MVVKSRAACSTVPLASLEKKLAPRSPFSANGCAIVRDIVDFPVPAMPFSQNTHSPFGSSAHCIISSRRATQGVGVASRVMLVGVRIECCIFRDWESVENEPLADIENMRPNDDDIARGNHGKGNAIYVKSTGKSG